VAVEDNGPGIPADERRAVFETRYRGQVEPPGSGLGLAIAQDASRQLGGSLFVEDGSDGGARFVLRIPLPPPAESGGGEFGLGSLRSR